MKRIFVLVIMLLVGSGCSVRGGATGARTSVAKNLVRVQIASDPQLNRYEKNSHALVLCLYQLDDPESFTRLAQGSGGVPKLLECGRFDAAVLNARQVVVQPGQRLTEMRERLPGARYLGIATGYYSTGRRNVTALAAIPETGGESVLHIELGAQEIRQVRVE
ncbi:T6SS secretion lipoprotein TssJ [Citrifermentans bremense]|uniref:T6SS secretion lipoprotein TssJ n=1 Tax=Citrifermentans bremense TaxID=60035 RepID=A0A6S6LXS4_9BACT|nr:type VI secretion system lipoprotein TssJ [Citrifermentans bremense]BCG46403.1 T6SS secretion lipoprotein TssJ [Citrifermentans bremense]